MTENVNNDGDGFVTMPTLWKIIVGIVVAAFTVATLLFTVHKEAPHTGAVPVERFDDLRLYLDQRFDAIDDKLTRLEVSG